MPQTNTLVGDQVRLQASTCAEARETARWPAGQAVAPLIRSMASATFADWATYHPALVEAVLAAETDPRFRDATAPQGSAVKVRGIPQWRSPSADLVQSRALLLAYEIVGRRTVYVDNAWASVYRSGDYCVPHSHRRATISIIYMLDPGDASADDELSGKLYFADPRIPNCCAHEPDRVTRIMAPEMNPGVMLIFASEYVHGVNPYKGTRPRITLSWNIMLERLAEVQRNSM